MPIKYSPLGLDRNSAQEDFIIRK